MLHIIANNKCYLTDKPSCETVRENPIPLPKQPNLNKISYTKWYELYKNDIDKLVDIFLSQVEEFSSDTYLCQINYTQLENDFINLLYKTSNNSYKTYPI